MKPLTMAKAVKKAVAKKALKKAAVSRKTAVKKSTKTVVPGKKAKEKTIQIKYADKSAGQPELVPVFEKIRKMLMAYSKKRQFVLHEATYGQANLVSHKKVEIEGRSREELWFASALIQKGYVGFYFIPVNASSPLRQKISPELMKCLKGKACFHIKKDDPLLMKDIADALQLGYDAFVKLDWI